MNKRIQKKLHKRLEHEAEIAAQEAAAITGERPSLDALGLMREGAARVKQALREGDPRGAVRAVQERASEAIGQVKGRVRDKLSETERAVKEKLEETEQRAEALLDKVPVVGAAAAKKLHGLTHS
jgi:hypothetical protein